MSKGSGRIGPAVLRAALALLGIAWLTGCSDTPEGTIKLKGTREEQAERIVNPFGAKTKEASKTRVRSQYDLSKSVKNRPVPGLNP